MTSIIDQLLSSPKLPLYVEQITALLNAERERREAFYEHMSEQEKVEFINGEVIVHSPVKIEHADASENLLMLLKAYVHVYDLGIVHHEKLLISLTRNDYEPDICYFRKEVADTFVPGQMQFPAPDLIIEVLSPSTEDRDRGVKFEDYAAHGVGEYWLIEPATKTVEQYTLAGETYTLQTKTRSGTLRSVAVRGFEIPIAAIFERELMMSTLRAIVAASPEQR
jgi:Uma2 family endonuclease